MSGKTPAKSDENDERDTTGKPAGSPLMAKKRTKALVLAVVLSLLTLYTNTNTDRYEGLAFEYNITNPLPQGSYALCSAEGGARGVYTVDATDGVVECVLVVDEWVKGTGSLGEVQDLWKGIEASDTLPVARVPEGAVVLPGFADSHCHILEYGFSKQIPLEGLRTIKESVEAVAHYVQSNPDILTDDGGIVEGWGWDHEAFEGGKMPTASDLSSHPVLANRQIILSSKDGHATWVSQATLDANGPYPADVDGGVIVRDAQGNVTGVFIDTAMTLIKPPVITPQMQHRRFTNTVRDALSFGLTSLHDAGFNPISLDFFTRQSKRHAGLPLRIYGMSFFNVSAIDVHSLTSPPAPSSSSIDAYWGSTRRKVDDMDGETRLSVRSVKIFADGALRTMGAALYEPYADDPSTSGSMRLSAEVLNAIVPRFLEDGWQVNVHAIGDRANGLVLDAFELALRNLGLDSFNDGAHPLRPRLEHAQVISERDVKRVADMGVIASVQPSHAISDMWYGEDRLGPDRVKQLYPFQSLLEAGARLTLGSDFPVDDINPLAGFYAAITRIGKDGKSPHGPGGWFPNQRLTRRQALRGMTIDAAYASFTERTLGSLEPGKKADLVVLDRDVMNVDVNDILGTRVVATVVDGRVVYGGV